MASVQVAQGSQRPLKRKRTLRACDYCRSHRIRCDYQDDSDRCQHCISYGLVCEKIRPSPKTKHPTPQPDEAKTTDNNYEPGYSGPTSFIHMVHQACKGNASLNQSKESSITEEEHYCFGAQNGAGGMLELRDGIAAHANRPRPAALSFTKTEARLVDEVGHRSVLGDLLKTAQVKILTLYPVISVTESVGPDGPDDRYWQHFTSYVANSVPPTPLPHISHLILCALASLSRQVSDPIRVSILSALREQLDLGDEMDRIGRVSSIAGVQILLLLSLSEEIHAEDPLVGKMMLWQRTGTAIRMAQDLGLHRDIPERLVSSSQLHRRHRVWGSCVIMDHFLAMRTGRPLTINLEDCDAPEPFIYPDHVTDMGQADRPPCFRFLAEVTKLSALLGRTLRLAKRLRGLGNVDDFSLLTLELDIDLWIQQLPEKWPYGLILDVPEANEFMNLLLVSVLFTFQQAFDNPKCPIPAHITYRPSQAKIDELVQRAERAVQWMVSGAGLFHLDVFSVIVYAFACCAIVFLQRYNDTQDLNMRNRLGQVQQVFAGWASVDDLSEARRGRKKTAALVALLDSTAGGTAGESVIADLPFLGVDDNVFNDIDVEAWLSAFTAGIQPFPHVDGSS